MIAFKVKCTRSEGGRFKLNQTYEVCYRVGNGIVEFSYLIPDDNKPHEIRFTGRFAKKEILMDTNALYKIWYDGCVWTNYDFKLISSRYEVSLI